MKNEKLSSDLLPDETAYLGATTEKYDEPCREHAAEILEVLPGANECLLVAVVIREHLLVAWDDETR